MRSRGISRVLAAWAVASAAACAPPSPRRPPSQRRPPPPDRRRIPPSGRSASSGCPVSYNERPFQPGKYGEEILANSAD